MTAPRISVVVPSYNQGGFLSDCLESILSQNYAELELIVMDGGSTDQSVSIIREHSSKIAFWQSKPDGGQAAAINAGVARATGEIVGWLNSDDLYAAGALAVVADAFEKHPGHGLYFGNGLRLHQDTNVRTPFSRTHVALNRNALREGVDYLQQPSVFFSRAAWNAVGGLDETLEYCMDWDILIRVAESNSALAINEFLSISREYEATKTASGGMRRAAEIIAMSARHVGRPLTVGGVLYFLETLLQPGFRQEFAWSTLNGIYELIERIKDNDLSLVAETRIGFPISLERDDEVYLPLAKMAPPLGTNAAASSCTRELPKISVVVPSFNQAHFLRRTLDSILNQNYPSIEIIVIDGNSTDDTVQILKEYSEHITYWVSEPDNGPAHAISKGFRRATGRILAWLASDDMYAAGALRTVGEAFANNEKLSMAVGNAIYVDENDRLKIVDHGEYSTAMYYGVIRPREVIPAYWSYVHSIPQPSTFFTRDLFESVGGLNEGYQFIFDFELFFRMVSVCRPLKLERTLSFYRIHSGAKTSSWNDFLVELYSFSRPWWPSLLNPEFGSTLRSFTGAFMARVWGPGARGFRFRVTAIAVALLATSRFVNVEAFALHFTGGNRTKRPAIHLPQLCDFDERHSKGISRGNRNDALGSILFCSYGLPRYPGFSGGEIRDFHIVEELLNHSRFSLVSMSSHGGASSDLLSSSFDSYFDSSYTEKHSEFVDASALKKLRSPLFALSRLLNRLGIAVPGRRFPYEASTHIKVAQAYLATFVRKFLREHRPQFLVVSPQSNGIALLLREDIGNTRTIMASYDVEAVRYERMAAVARGHRRLLCAVEARRAAAFERANLACYDGVIAVSELDRRSFIDRYGLPAERVAVVENGVDTEYFSFATRTQTNEPAIIFVASMGYEPNHLAAMRLVDRIMPHVWNDIPEAKLWLVGQAPRAELLARSDGQRIFVTGAVPSVRSYLRAAQVMCAPLTAGSGTKYKVLEALSAGVPSVCTSLAIEGLDVRPDVHVKVADDDLGLAKQVLGLLQDRASAADLAERGRALVEARYAWKWALRDLQPWLAKIGEMPKVSAHSQAPDG